MALLIFHSSCIGYVLSLARMGLFHGTFKLRQRKFYSFFSRKEKPKKVLENLYLRLFVRNGKLLFFGLG